jgi:hypothetical protein
VNEVADGSSFQTMLLAIVPSKIALFKAIIESYDNLATMRTEDPRHHYIRLYFDAASAAQVKALLDSLSADFSIRRMDSENGPQ